MRARAWTSILSMMAVGANAVGCGSDARTDCASYSDCTADGAGMDGETVLDGGPEVAAPDAEMGTVDASHPSDAARGGDADAAVDAFVCDPTQSPSAEPCVVDEAYGIFVAPAGSDANPGTKALPVATIGRGMDLAKTASKRVYVCAGRFAEKVAIGTSRDGAAVFGGLDCATWHYDTNNKVIVAPAQTGYALELDGLQQGATLEDVEFDALDANPSHPGESSVAVFANGAQNVVLRRVAMVAGAVVATGGAGPSGGTAGDPSNAYAGSLNGTSAGDAGAPSGKTSMCVDGTASVGGAGRRHQPDAGRRRTGSTRDRQAEAPAATMFHAFQQGVAATESTRRKVPPTPPSQSWAAFRQRDGHPLRRRPVRTANRVKGAAAVAMASRAPVPEAAVRAADAGEWAANRAVEVARRSHCSRFNQAFR